jgi:hypothetical protein
MYRLTHFGKTRRGIPGVPWRDLSDAEYRAAVKANPGMEDQGYFVKVEEEKPEAKPEKKGRLMRTPAPLTNEEPPATPPAEEEVND